MQDSGPQKVRKAVVVMEHEAQILVSLAHSLSSTASAWQNRDLLKQAREYARAVDAVTRSRRLSR
jgi:hypothetical protein